MRAIFPVPVCVGKEFLSARAGIFGHGFTLYLAGVGVPPFVPAVAAAEYLLPVPRVLKESLSAVFAEFPVNTGEYHILLQIGR